MIWQFSLETRELMKSEYKNNNYDTYTRAHNAGYYLLDFTISNSGVMNSGCTQCQWASGELVYTSGTLVITLEKQPWI